MTDSLSVAVHAFASRVSKQKVPCKTITDVDNADDIALLANAPAHAETLLHSLEWAAAGISLHVNAHKMEYMHCNQKDDISTLNCSSLKVVDKFTCLWMGWIELFNI